MSSWITLETKAPPLHTLIEIYDGSSIKPGFFIEFIHHVKPMKDFIVLGGYGMEICRKEKVQRWRVYEPQE